MLFPKGVQMKNKTFWIGFAVVYVVWQAMGYLIHEVMLGEMYQSLASMWRSEQQMRDMMWIIFLTSAIYLFLFCYIFTFGYEAKGWIEGLRYGVLIGLFMSVPMAFDSYVIYPLPINLAWIWLVTGVIQFAIVGAIFAAIYKPGR